MLVLLVRQNWVPSYVEIEALGLCWFASNRCCHTWRSKLWACDGSAGSPALGTVIRGDRGFGPVLVLLARQHWVLSYVEIEALGLCWFSSIWCCHTWRWRLWAWAGSSALGAVIRGDRGFGPVMVLLVRQHWVLSYVEIEALGLCWFASIGCCHTWRSGLWTCAGSPALGAVLRGDRGLGPVLVLLVRQNWVLSYVVIEALGM